MKLIGKVSGIARSIKGKPLVTFEFDADDALELTDEKMTVEIKPFKQKRSLDANSYAWVLIGRLAEVLGKPRTEIYREYIREIGAFENVCVKDNAVERLREGWEHNGLGWVTEVIPSKIDGCKVVVLHYGSSVYDTTQMSKLIDLIIQDCKQFGIETDTPAEIQRMKEAWK